MRVWRRFVCWLVGHAAVENLLVGARRVRCRRCGCDYDRVEQADRLEQAQSIREEGW